LRTPKGFGKRYFSLMAILAHAVAPRLHATQCRFRFAYDLLLFDAEEEEDPPPSGAATLCPLIPFLSSGYTPSRACHCNRLFRRRAILLLKRVRLIPKCTCNCRFFSFRRTGTHPPRLSFFQTR
jgi:hypothetical protein